MTRFLIEIGDQLQFGGATMNFEERRNDQLDFRDTKTNERKSVTDAELSVEIAEGKTRLIRQSCLLDHRDFNQTQRAVDFSLHPTGAREAARTRLAYVQAAQAFGEKISNVDLQRSIDDTAKQIQDANKPCTRTVRRYLRRGGRMPVASNFLTANAAKGNREDRLDSQVRDIIDENISKYFMKRPPISVKTLLNLIRAGINNFNKEHNLALSVPSYNSVKRAVNRCPPRDLKEARYGKVAADEEFKAVSYQKSPVAPLDLVELDHTKTDLMVITTDNFLPLGRATAGIGKDRCTRAPWGIYLGFEPPSVHTVMQVLKNGILPKTYLERKVRDGEWDIKHTWPVCGKPKALLLDRALENIGSDLDDFAAEAKIHLRFARRKTGADKGSLERFLKDLNKTLLHEQRGTTFSNILDRDDYDPAKNAVITFDELLYVIHRWMLDVYAWSPNLGLKDVPMRCWNELTIKYPVEPLEDVDHLNMLFGRVEARTLQRTGIQFEWINYVSDELVSLLNNIDFLKNNANQIIKFRYDPGDLSTIRAYDPTSDKYIVVPPCGRDADYVVGLSIWQHRLIVKHWRSRIAENADYDGKAQAKLEIAQIFENAWTSRKIGHRSKAARFRGVGRFSPAGSNEQTNSTPLLHNQEGTQESGVIGTPKTLGKQATQEVAPQLKKITGRKAPKPAEQSPSYGEDEGDLYAQK